MKKTLVKLALVAAMVLASAGSVVPAHAGPMVPVPPPPGPTCSSDLVLEWGWTTPSGMWGIVGYHWEYRCG